MTTLAGFRKRMDKWRRPLELHGSHRMTAVEPLISYSETGNGILEGCG